jgi:RecG-like helicase
MGLLRGRRAADDQAAEAVDQAAGAVDAVASTAIAAVVPRRRVQVVGEVTRMRAQPTSGLPALAVTLSDGTGTVVAMWTGRRAIGGITLGRRLLLDGVPRRVGDRLELVNPAYTLLDR